MPKINKSGVSNASVEASEDESWLGNNSSVLQEKAQNSDENMDSEDLKPVLMTENPSEKDLTENSSASMTDGESDNPLDIFDGDDFK